MSSSGNIGDTAETRIRVTRDALTAGGRNPASDETKAPQAPRRSFAGSASRTLPPESAEASTRRRSGVPKRSASAGASAPPPRERTESSGARSGSRDDSSTLSGDPARAELVKKRRALTRASQQDMRDPFAVESGLGYTEEKAFRGVTVTSYQRSFSLLLIFLGSMGV